MITQNYTPVEAKKYKIDLCDRTAYIQTKCSDYSSTAATKEVHPGIYWCPICTTMRCIRRYLFRNLPNRQF